MVHPWTAERQRRNPPLARRRRNESASKASPNARPGRSSRCLKSSRRTPLSASSVPTDRMPKVLDSLTCRWSDAGFGLRFGRSSLTCGKMAVATSRQHSGRSRPHGSLDARTGAQFLAKVPAGAARHRARQRARRRFGVGQPEQGGTARQHRVRIRADLPKQALVCAETARRSTPSRTLAWPSSRACRQHAAALGRSGDDRQVVLEHGRTLGTLTSCWRP